MISNSNHQIQSQNPISPPVDIVVESNPASFHRNINSTTNPFLIRSIKTKQIQNSISTRDNNLLGIPSSNLSASSATCDTSEPDNISGGEGSLESLDVKMWHRSESDNPPSSISSISLDSQSEEGVLDFMRRFVSILFSDSASITLELKAEFGQYSRVSM